MNILNSPQLHLFDKAVTMVMDKQRYQQQLQSTISITLSSISSQQSCLTKVLCMNCLKTQKQHKLREKILDRAQNVKALLTNREQNETLFCIRLQEQQGRPDQKEEFIGSWYDLLVFAQWQNQQTQQQVVTSVKGIQRESIFNDIHHDNSSSNAHNNLQSQWYSKIILWFSSYQFTIVFFDRQQHQHLFHLLITLKQYYTKLHPQSQYNSLILRHYVQYNGNQLDQMNSKQIAQLIRGMNFNQKQFAAHLNQVEEYKNTQTLSRDSFMKLISVLQCPSDLFKIYMKFTKSFAKNHTKYEMYSEDCMTQEQFRKFLKEVQHENGKLRPTSINFQSQNWRKSQQQSQQQSQQKISQKLLTPPASSSNFSFITFCRHILSLSKNPAIQPQEINPKFPLPQYYINSSHNTYLVGNQLTSMSSSNIYYLNLLEGMRCVQLDIHDSPKGPIIKHGYTLTAEITFDDAIKAIMKFCYQNPQHTPIVLSFENHCTEINRRKMTRILEKIPKEKFYCIPQTGSNTEQFLCLSELTGKIIIQGTGVFEQLYPKIDKYEKTFSKSKNDQLKPQDLVYLIGNQQNLMLFAFDQNKNQQTNKKKSDFVEKAKQLQNQKHLFEQMMKNMVDKLCSKWASKKEEQLSTFYGMVASPFNLQNSCWQMANIAQNNIMKMINGEIKPTPQDIYRYSSHSLIRIYPFGLRFNSSNFNPIPMLQCGCQLVSLNTQNVDVYYVMMQGLFEKNKNCGYAKKKDFKKQDEKEYRVRIVFMDCLNLKPRKVQNINLTTSLQISFIGAQQDMKQNCKYINYQQSPNFISFNEPITISQPIPCKTLQSQFIAVPQFQLTDMPRILNDISQTKYPHVDFIINSIDFGHLYVNLLHCGSISVPLADLRQGLRIVPIYCYQIGRKKRMGSLLVYVEITVNKK